VRVPWRRRRRNAELDEEIRSHLAMSARDHEARGESPTEAIYAARREFGNATLVRETTRRMWGGAWLADLGQDLRLAMRSAQRAPAFTSTVVVVLGLGMGAAGAMYGILDRLLLRPPEHVQDPDRLFSPYITNTDFRGAEATRGRMQWREARLLANGMGVRTSSTIFTGPSGASVSIGDVEVNARMIMASTSYFEVLGVRPLRGRLFLPEDSASAAPAVAVIGYGFWQRRFGGAQDVVGRRIRQGKVMYTIVGVAPRGFSGTTPEQVDLWLPAEKAAPSAHGSEWPVNHFSWEMVARLRLGQTGARAAAAGFIRLRTAPPNPRYRVGGEYRSVQAGSIVPGRSPVGPGAALRLSCIVAGAAVLVALIALANAAGLLFLRALRRRRETAVRLVLGVSRGRLVGAVAVESVVLAALAGLVACVVAAVTGELLRRLLLRVDWAVPVVDLQVGALTLVASLTVGAVAGLLPGWLAGRPETLAALKSGVREAGPRRSLARTALLSAQAGLSLVLLAGLSLYLRSFQRARAFDFGPDVDRLLVAELQQRTNEYPSPVGREISDAVAARVAELRGVESVALSNSNPLWSFVGTAIRVEGLHSFPRSMEGPFVVESSPGYFATTGLRLLRGRNYMDQGPGGPREAVVSEEMARVIGRSGDAVGRCLYVGRGSVDCRRIVGVVKDLRVALTHADPVLTYYIPLSQSVMLLGAATLIVRADKPARLVPAVREIAASVARVRDPEAVQTLRDVVDPQYRRLRQGITLFGIFAALAVMVAMIGLYSVVAYSVTQRAHEFGVRVALGARATNLVRLVLRQALGYTAAGLLLGLAVAILGGRYLTALLYQTSPRDPLALLAAALALVVAALVACILPARAAARADPRQALQAE
jgi:predicted permease